MHLDAEKGQITSITETGSANDPVSPIRRLGASKPYPGQGAGDPAGTPAGHGQGHATERPQDALQEDGACGIDSIASLA